MKSRATEAGRFVTHDGAELYYELRGAGSPVVLVAGVGDDIASWDTVEHADAGAISQPALVIAGEQDTVTPPELSAQLANRLPNAELVSLDAGHSSFVERPGEWLEIVGRFIKRASTRRSVRPAPPRPAGPVGP